MPKNGPRKGTKRLGAQHQRRELVRKEKSKRFREHSGDFLFKSDGGYPPARLFK